MYLLVDWSSKFCVVPSVLVPNIYEEDSTKRHIGIFSAPAVRINFTASQRELHEDEVVRWSPIYQWRVDLNRAEPRI